MAKKKSSSSKGSKKGGDDVDFETALAEVERIVHQLESGELDLTESLEQYEMGVKYLKSCHAILSSAERRVTILSGFDADGNPVAEPVSEASGMAPGPSKADEGASGPLGGAGGTQRSMDGTPGLF